MNTALAIITDSNKVLIGKLKPEMIKEYGNIEYVFPSAQSNNKENLQQALVEEVKMQLNIDVTTSVKIGERIHPVTQNLTEYYFIEKRPEQEMVLSKDADIEKFIWVDTETLTQYMPSLFEEVKEFLENNVR